MSDSAADPKDLRLLVLGYGSIGRRHIANLRQLGVDEIVAVDPREDRRAEAEAQLGVSVARTLEDALDQAPDAALVCTPPAMHVEHALAAARAGCDLFIEKPLANAFDGLDALEREVTSGGLMCLVGCNFRFDAGLHHVKTLLDRGAVGKVVSARAQFGQYLPDWHPWEDYRNGYSASLAQGGGIVLDRIHEIDYMRWLLGDVDRVVALTGRLSGLEIDTEDTAEILLRFASGALGSIHLDYVRRTYDCSLEVVGTEGTVQWRYQDRLVRWYLADEGVWRSLQWPDRDSNDVYVAEMAHFLRVLAREEAPALGLEEARRDLELALVAKQGHLQPIGVQVV